MSYNLEALNDLIEDLQGQVSALDDMVRGMVVAYGHPRDAEFLQELIDDILDEPKRGRSEVYHLSRTDVFERMRQMIDIKLSPSS